MEPLFFYFGKIIFTSGVMFLYYKLFLKDKTFHHYNRFYLLAAVGISLFLPLLKVSYFTLEVNSNIYLLINRLQNLSLPNNLNDDFNYFKTGAFLTGLVAVFFLTKLMFGLFKIQLLKQKFNKENFEGINFYQTDLADAPFSYFKNLFWKNSIEIQFDLGRQSLRHSQKYYMKKHLLFVVLISAFTHAQNKRFTYEYSFATDSANKANVSKEMLVLDVVSTGSKFYSYGKFKDDSLKIVELKRQANSGSEILNFTPTYKGKIHYSISKNYPGFETFMHHSLGSDNYKILDDRKMNWKIIPEKQKIGEFESQKAEITMYGRKWIAWFTTEITIQDGPYKFHGLPGLIVKIDDHAKTHSFDLKGITNFSNHNQLQMNQENNNEVEIPIGYVKYKKLFQEQRNDPGKSLREMLNRPGISIKMIGPDGNELKASEVLRQRELKGIENRKINNNPLELDLLK